MQSQFGVGNAVCVVKIWFLRLYPQYLNILVITFVVTVLTCGFYYGIKIGVLWNSSLKN